MITARTPRVVALAAALALPLALLASTPASAATVGVATWTDLKAAFLVDSDTVRLDADITAAANEPLLIESGESIILDLNGHALTITAPGSNNPAISVPASSSLSINATSGGALTATGGGFAAGIGGGSNATSGTTIINGGTITATGGIYGSGIGGGEAGDGGTTTITGGTVNATGGDLAAGIGGGIGGDGGTTTITGGTLIATGGELGAGIGGGRFGDGGTTTTTGGTTTATGGNNAAGIGGGEFGVGGVFEVNGAPIVGAATDGGAPAASPITNPVKPAGVGYSATTSTVSGGGRIELRFNYLINFTANGGSTTASQTIDDGDPLPEPATPTREGFTFAGWTAAGSAYDFTTPVTAPLTLSATWTALLAATGTDITTALGIATLLTAGGVILIALRRRATKRSA